MKGLQILGVIDKVLVRIHEGEWKARIVQTAVGPQAPWMRTVVVWFVIHEGILKPQGKAPEQKGTTREEQVDATVLRETSSALHQPHRQSVTPKRTNQIAVFTQRADVK